jgi:hypothetical protein
MFIDDRETNIKLSRGPNVDIFKISFQIQTVLFMVIEDCWLGFRIHPSVDQVPEYLVGS